MRSAMLRCAGAALLASALAFLVSLTQPAPAAAAQKQWQGSVGADSARVRSAPASTAPSVGVLSQGEPITVVGWVTGEEVEKTNDTWAVLGDGQYVYSGLIVRNAPSGPPPVPNGVSFQGKWIDVNVTQQLLTAYEGSEPVHLMMISSGRPAYPSPQGTFRVLRRVPSVTMDSSSLPWVRDSYRLDNVRFTQYFNEFGAALHEAYWKLPDSFGIPTSHGCVGMPSNEAEWLWNWAQVGTPVYIHP